MIWKDRKYINPRKRVFKNMDTNEILNLEIQDDLDNIEEESETPLNAHNLNMAQQDLLDDMSKTYTGTNITGPTVEGYGTIHKLYGHTVEEGTGEKSPSNPYMLKCVADDVNLFDGVIRQGGSGSSTDTNRLFSTQSLYLKAGETYTLSTNLDINTYRWAVNVNSNTFPTNTAPTYDSGWKQAKEISFIPTQSGYFGIGISRVDNANLTPTNISQYHFKVQKGSVATPYSPYGYGTVEIISKNGDEQSSNIVATKPLCCLKNGDNIMAQDWIDYDRGVVHRECEYRVLDGTEDWQASGNAGAFYRFGLAGITNTDTSKAILCSHFRQYQNWDMQRNHILIGSSPSTSIWIMTDVATTVQAFKAWLASNPVTFIYQLATPTEEPLNCSNKIVQYSTQTTVSNRDGAKIEVSLTNNEAISEVNGELGGLQEKQIQMHNYSTEEQVVGTWIDGKPLYRRVFEISSSERASFEDNLVQNIDMGMLLGGYILTGGGTKHSVELNGSYRISVKLGNNMYFVSDATNVKIVKYSIIVIYTKTTD